MSTVLTASSCKSGGYPHHVCQEMAADESRLEIIYGLYEPFVLSIMPLLPLGLDLHACQPHGHDQLLDKLRRPETFFATERVYQDAKGELGLDHYEGRSYRGWNHHVSVVLVCFAFIVAERVRSFPPSAGKAAARPSRKHRYGADSGSPGTALRGLVHNRPASRCSRSGHMAATLPALPSTATVAFA